MTLPRAIPRIVTLACAYVVLLTGYLWWRDTWAWAEELEPACTDAGWQRAAFERRPSCGRAA